MTALKRQVPGLSSVEKLKRRVFHLERQFTALKTFLASKFADDSRLREASGAGLSPTAITAATEELRQELAQARSTLAEMEKELSRAKTLLAEKDSSLEDQGRIIAGQAEELGKARNLLAEREEANAALRAELISARNESALYKEALRQKESEMARACLKIRSLENSRLPWQEELKRIWHGLEELSPKARELIGRYFDLARPLAFFPAFGFFSRIEQLWDLCALMARQNALPADMPLFLQMALEIYNAANPDSVAALANPAPDSPYDYSSQDRVGPSGSRIKACLLPGLLRPTGQLCKKSLVSLK